MYGYIYETTNNINGKKYIGKHEGEFDNNYKGSGKYLWRAVRKYGIENFEVRMIEKCNSLDELNEKEKYWISYYDATKSENYYNIASGGDGGNLISGLNKEEYNEFRRKQSIIAKNKDTGISRFASKPGESNPMYGKRGKDSPHYGNQYAKGRKMSEEEKKMRSKAHNSNNIPPSSKGTKWMNNGKLNKQVLVKDIDSMKEQGFVIGRIKCEWVKNKRSEETKRKTGKSSKGTKFINNGIINSKAKGDKLQYMLNNGWKLGRV